MRKPWVVTFIVGGIAIASGCGSVGETLSEPSSLVSISASGAVMGQQGRIRIAFSNPIGTATDVMLTSASTGIATAPDHVTVAAGATSADIQYTAVAPGVAVFRATAKNDTQTTTATVVDILRVGALSTATFEVGAHGIISQYMNISVPDAIAVSLASSQTSIATVDSSVMIPEFSSSGLAQVTAVSPGASIITASYNGEQATQTVTVLDKARIAQVYGTRLFEVGGHGNAQILLDAQLANATQLAVTPSELSVVSVSRSYTITPGSNYANLDVQGMAVGSTNLVFSLNGSTGTLPIAVLSKAQLEDVRVNGTPSVGDSTQMTIDMDVVAATAHDVALMSSDPTVVTVPSTVTVFAGTSQSSVAITPLKAGDSVITATYNGISRQVAVHVETSGYTSGYTLSLYGQNHYAIGTIGQISIQTGSPTPTMVSLVSSDPSVVSVPSSIVVAYYSETAPINVMHAGTATITASSNGKSATVSVSVLASPGIQQFGPSFTVPVNGSINANLYLDSQPPAGTNITFLTSNASIAPAPATISVSDGRTYIPLEIRGGNSGTATLTATVGGTKASAVVYVGGSTTTTSSVFSGVFINGASTVEIGAATILSALFFPPPPSGDTGTITVGTPGILTTPSTTLAISSIDCCNKFPVIGAVAGTSDVTVTVGGVSQTATVTVVSSPTYTLSVPSIVKVNSSVTAQIFSNAAVAANRTFALSSSNSGVATVTSTTATIGPGNFIEPASFGVHGVAAGTATITATNNGKNFTANITVQ